MKTVPQVPHPYTGKLTDKLSQNVKVNGRRAATKGSRSKNNPPLHLPMTPGVKFVKTPNNEGEVTSGTIPNVKINGKEAAVLGSRVKTCNDPVPQETCRIIAAGTAPKLPMEIPVTNSIDRSVINPKWDKVKALAGERVKLQTELKNQYEYATVEYKIYPEGADISKDQPIQKLYGRNTGGKSEVEWEFKYAADRDKPLKEKPKFIFTAESFGCYQVTSGTVEIGMEIDIKCTDAFGMEMKDEGYELDNSGETGKSNSKGIIRKRDVIPGEIIKFKLN